MNDIVFGCKELGCNRVIIYDPKKERIKLFGNGDKYKNLKDYDVYLRCEDGHTYKYWIHEEAQS